jgi:hypothetical protein
MDILWDCSISWIMRLQDGLIKIRKNHFRRLDSNTDHCPLIIVNMLLIRNILSAVAVLNAVVSILAPMTIVGSLGLSTVEAQKIRSRRMSNRGAGNTPHEILTSQSSTTRALKKATGSKGSKGSKGPKGSKQDAYFQRVSSFPLCSQYELACDDDTETAAEITTVSEDGMTLIYTDPANERIGFVHIPDPANPIGIGTLKVGGEPVSISQRGKVRR